MSDSEGLSQVMRRWRVEYHTKPSPALSYYEGEKYVYAEDSDSAEDTARRELTRSSPDYRGSIIIDSVEEV